MYCKQCSNDYHTCSSFSVMLHKNELVVIGKGQSHLLVSVLLTRSGNFEQVRVDRQKGSIWMIIIVLQVYVQPIIPAWWLSIVQASE